MQIEHNVIEMLDDADDDYYYYIWRVLVKIKEIAKYLIYERNNTVTISRLVIIINK